MIPPEIRAALALLLVSSWMVLLFIGWTLGGVVHFFLALALLVFPWRGLRGGREPGGNDR